MRTKLILLSTTALLSAGVAMHHFRYCPLQHLMSAMAKHKVENKTVAPVLALKK